MDAEPTTIYVCPACEMTMRVAKGKLAVIVEDAVALKCVCGREVTQDGLCPLAIHS